MKPFIYLWNLLKATIFQIVPVRFPLLGTILSRTAAEVVTNGPIIHIFWRQSQMDLLMVGAWEVGERGQRCLQCCVLFYSGTVGVTEQLKEWSFHLFHGSHCSGYLHKLSIIFNSTQPCRQESRAMRIDKILPVPRALCVTHSSTAVTLGNKGLPLWRTQFVPGTVLNLLTLILPYHPQNNPTREYCYCSKAPSCPCRGTVPASTTSQHLFTSLFQTS